MNSVKTIYVVHYCEVENCEVIDKGVCDEVFTNECDAISKMYDLSDDKMNDLIDEYDENDIYRDSFSSGDMLIVHSPIGVYEYYISKCFYVNK